MKYAKTLLLIAFIMALVALQLLTAPYRLPSRVIKDLFPSNNPKRDTIQALIHGDRLGLDPAVLISVPDSIRESAIGYYMSYPTLYLVMGDSSKIKIKNL